MTISTAWDERRSQLLPCSTRKTTNGAFSFVLRSRPWRRSCRSGRRSIWGSCRRPLRSTKEASRHRLLRSSQNLADQVTDPPSLWHKTQTPKPTGSQWFQAERIKMVGDRFALYLHVVVSGNTLRQTRNRRLVAKIKLYKMDRALTPFHLVGQD